MIDIQCGQVHALFLMENGKVVSYGWNDYGQCGVSIDKDKLVNRN